MTLILLNQSYVQNIIPDINYDKCIVKNLEYSMVCIFNLSNSSDLYNQILL